jgi:hypothetical protein
MRAIAIAAGVIVNLAVFTTIAVGDAARTGGPQYSKNGALMFPTGYRDWTFVTSGLGMTYGPTGVADAQGNPNFDNVFVEPSSYQAFLQTGTWPDRTVLVIEARSSDSKASINKGGHFQSKVLRLEAHVKDSAREGWAFYDFEPGMKEAPAIPRSRNCYSCHEQHGAVDTTFVQFYPTLIDAARSHGTLRPVE